MESAGFAESGDAAVDEYTRELGDGLRRIRHVMKGVEADDPIDGRIRKIEMLAVEM
jgi:hypothetical protein